MCDGGMVVRSAPVSRASCTPTTTDANRSSLKNFLFFDCLNPVVLIPPNKDAKFHVEMLTPPFPKTPRSKLILCGFRGCSCLVVLTDCPAPHDPAAATGSPSTLGVIPVNIRTQSMIGLFQPS